MRSERQLHSKYRIAEEHMRYSEMFMIVYERNMIVYERNVSVGNLWVVSSHFAKLKK